MQLAGYDYPVRRLRRCGDSCCVTLPLQVRGFLAVKRGDWLAFGATPWRGVAAFLAVTDEQYQAIAAEGRQDFRRLARKVQSGSGSVFVNIPQGICEILAAEIGNFLMFGISPWPNMITLAVVKGGGESTGSRRSG
jgi:hypothetical protein